MLGWGVRESVLAGQVGVSRQYKITVLICCEYNDTLRMRMYNACISL